MIATDSPAYAKRIVREINIALTAGRSVYAVDYPFNQKVRSVTYGPNINKVIAICSDGRSRSYEATKFVEGNSAEICASRQ